MVAAETSRVSRVALANLTKHFAAKGQIIPAVEQLHLDVAAGELLALVGPSGCGKTTTLRLIAGLESPDSGSVALAGVVVNDVAPKDRAVAMVFQRDALFPHLTARENLGLGLKLRGVAREEIQQRVASVACTASPANFPAGSGSAWRWAARWCVNRKCCCWTNRSPISMRPCAANCAGNCCGCTVSKT